VPYATPGADIMPIIDAPPTPITYLAPGARFLALVHHESHPPIAMLARPYLPLAGVRLDPRLGARRRMRRLTGLSVVQTADGTERPLDLPAGSQVGPPGPRTATASRSRSTASTGPGCGSPTQPPARPARCRG
jgi:hypothetical protein